MTSVSYLKIILMQRFLDKIINGIRSAAFIIVFTVIFFLMIIGQLIILVYFTIFKATDSRKKKYHVLMHNISKWLITHIPGVKITVENYDIEKFKSPAIIVCNHQSHLDLLCLLMLAPNVIFVAKKWVWKNPLYGIVIRYADFISTEDDHSENIEKIRQMAIKGYSTVIFPEGTRSASCSVQRFHKGAFHAAQELKMDIVPIVLYGTGKVMNKKAFSITPGRIIIDVSDRIRYDENVDYTQRCKMVKEEITANYQKINTAENPV